MLTAIGTGVLTHADGTFDVTFEVRDDTGRLIRRQMVTASSKADLQQQVQLALNAIAGELLQPPPSVRQPPEPDPSLDAQLNQTIVGQVLVQV